MKNSNDTIWNRTSDIEYCIATNFSTVLRTTPYDLVSDFSVRYSSFSTLKDILTTPIQYFSSRSQDEQQQENHKFVLPVQVVWGVVARLPLWTQIHNYLLHSVNTNFAEGIVLVSNAQSTDQYNSCRANYVQKGHSWWSCILHL